MHCIPEEEIYVSFSRSGGPGGQNVNKVESRVTVRWPIGRSVAFSEAQKERIRAGVGRRRNKQDEIVITADDTRSQGQNRAFAVHRLNALVAETLMEKKKRKATKPSKASNERRLKTKKQRSEKKSQRRSFFPPLF